MRSQSLCINASCQVRIDQSVRIGSALPLLLPYPLLSCYSREVKRKTLLPPRSASETAGFLTLCLLLRRRVAGGGTPAPVRLVDRGSFVCPGVGIETVAMAAASWNNFSPSFPRSDDVVGEAVELVLCLGLIGVALVPAKLWAFVPGFLPRLAGDRKSVV